MRYGMSEKLGPRVLGRNTDMPFLGREMGHEPDYSDELAREIDDEVRRIIEDGHELALRVLREHLDELHRISQILIERETIDKDQFARLVARRERGRRLPGADDTRAAAAEAGARAPSRDQAAPVPAAGIGDAAARARGRQLRLGQPKPGGPPALEAHNARTDPRTRTGTDANAHVERWVRPVRTDCLGHLLIFALTPSRTFSSSLRPALQRVSTADRTLDQATSGREG